MKKETIEHFVDILVVALVANWALAKTGHVSIQFLADMADYGVIAAGAYFLYKTLRKIDLF